MSRLLAAQRALTLPGWIKEDLSRKAQAIPSLDLRFAEGKSLVDATTGANLVTFTRASSGTFVGSDGVLRTATTNSLLQSNTFTTTWSPNNITLTSGSTTSPAGTLDGWSLADNATSGNHNITQSISWAAATTTFSIYAKYNNHRWLGARIGATGNVFFGSWDLQNGVVGSSTVGATIGMQSVGNGWYRLIITAALTTTGTSNLLIQLNNADATTLTSYSGTGSSVYIWGAQLEQSATVGEYIPTTSTINSVPRFDHNPTTGESLGLLVEEQRTNLLQRSEEFDNAYWTKSASTISANSAVSPDGLTTADKLVEDTATTFHRVFANTPSQAASTAHSLSVYVKAAGRTVVRVELRDSIGGYAVQDFNLTTLAVTSAGSGTGTISSVGNGWYRCTVTGTSSASGGVGTALFWALAAAGTPSYTGDGTSGIYLWGAQLEAGAFPTSYIPTTAATATRSADVPSSSGTAFSSWYRQDEGSLFVETKVQPFTVTNFARLASFDRADGSTNFIGIVRSSSLSQHEFSVFATTGQAVALRPATTFTSDSTVKTAAVYKADDFIAAANGVLSPADTSGSVPTSLTALGIGMQGNGSLQFNGHIRRLTYWPQRLSNSTLQTLTQ